VPVIALIHFVILLIRESGLMIIELELELELVAVW